MATRSAIGYSSPGPGSYPANYDTVTAVYCHWDGHPVHQLPILRRKYNSLDSVKDLIAPGSMSFLESDEDWKGNKRDPQPLYYRERGDEDKPVESVSLNAAFSHWKRADCQWLYIYTDEGWQHYPLN